MDPSIRQEFWDDLEEVVQHVPRGEKLIIGGDLNGLESIHGGFVSSDYDGAHHKESGEGGPRRTQRKHTTE